jgi:hypothetical protein
MRVEVKPNGYNFMALIDIRSPYNFLHPRVFKRVGLNVSRYKLIGVNITDGSRI